MIILSISRISYYNESDGILIAAVHYAAVLYSRNCRRLATEPAVDYFFLQYHLPIDHIWQATARDICKSPLSSPRRLSQVKFVV